MIALNIDAGLFDQSTAINVDAVTSYMATFGGAIGPADFQEPNSPDPTSPPAIPDTSQPAPGPQNQTSSPLAVAIRKSKQKKSQQPKRPATLAAAIARSRSARPSARKWG